MSPLHVTRKKGVNNNNNEDNKDAGVSSGSIDLSTLSGEAVFFDISSASLVRSARHLWKKKKIVVKYSSK